MYLSVSLFWSFFSLLFIVFVLTAFTKVEASFFVIFPPQTKETMKAIVVWRLWRWSFLHFSPRLHFLRGSFLFLLLSLFEVFKHEAFSFSSLYSLADSNILRNLSMFVRKLLLFARSILKPPLTVQNSLNCLSASSSSFSNHSSSLLFSLNRRTRTEWLLFFFSFLWNKSEARRGKETLRRQKERLKFNFSFNLFFLRSLKWQYVTQKKEKKKKAK